MWCGVSRKDVEVKIIIDFSRAIRDVWMLEKGLEGKGALEELVSAACCFAL